MPDTLIVGKAAYQEEKSPQSNTTIILDLQERIKALERRVQELESLSGCGKKPTRPLR